LGFGDSRNGERPEISLAEKGQIDVSVPVEIGADPRAPVHFAEAGEREIGILRSLPHKLELSLPLVEENAAGFEVPLDHLPRYVFPAFHPFRASENNIRQSVIVEVG